MLVEESRMLQVSVFNTLQKNLAHIDFSILLTGVMTISDDESGNDQLCGPVSTQVPIRPDDGDTAPKRATHHR